MSSTRRILALAVIGLAFLGSACSSGDSGSDGSGAKIEALVKDQLGPKIQQQGLALDDVACPDVELKGGETGDCDVSVSGVDANVSYEITSVRSGKARVEAKLDDGVVSVPKLVEVLESRGLTDVSCGDRKAVPATVGDKLTCTGTTPSGTEQKVTATIRSKAGRVTFS